MTTETLTFTCSICAEPSRDICVSCTKDACKNHRCERCKRCSDCCGCDVPLSAAEVEVSEQHQDLASAPQVPKPVMPEPEAILEEEPETAQPEPEPAPEAEPPDTRAWHDSFPELFRPDPEPRSD